jgi:NADH dehydrogenase
MVTETTKKRLVIVGGGFAGVRLARKLSGQDNLDITLISDRSYFAYYPQLYHTATGGDDDESALPLRELLNDTSVTLLHEAVTDIGVHPHTVTLTSGKIIPYDYAVLAMGVVTNYFGIKGLEENVFNIKSLEGAEKFKAHLHTELIENGKMDPNYVVVGAGPTGVELAATLGTYLNRVARSHKIKKPSYKVDLVEAAPRVLPRSSETVSAKVHKRLTKLGVNVMTEAVVEGATANELQLKGNDLATHTVVWTAGVANHPFFKAHTDSFKLAEKGGRVEVNEHLEGAADVYILGDNAATPFGGLAQTAINDANFVARDISARLNGRNRPVYKPRRPITVTPVGSGWAVVERGTFHMTGRLGWWLRRLADLIAYHDIQPWSKAVKVWLRNRVREDNCKICDAATQTT